MFSGDAVAKRPALALKIAEITCRWSMAQYTIATLCSVLLQTKAHLGAAMYAAITSSGSQDSVLDALADVALDEDMLDLYAGVKRVTKAPRNARNEIVHGIWAFAAELPDALLLTPQREHIVREGVERTEHHELARIAASDGGLQEMVDFTLTGDDHSKIMVWRASDFDYVIKQIHIAHVSWSYFTALLDQRDVLRSASRELMRQWLYEQPDVRAGVERARKDRGAPPLPPL